MNIHFKDEALLKALNKRTLLSIEVGSKMYNLNNEKSDVDMLNIYLEDKNNLGSFMWEHHQLQYKSNNTDFNFTTLQGFIRNALTGDATINIEVIFSEKLIGTELEFLYNNRYSFLTYNVLKSYLGLAKRDLKMLIKSSSNLRNFDEETNKKISHFVRGVMVAENILKNSEINLSDENTEILRKLKNGLYERLELKFLLSDYSTLMNDLRDESNDLLNKGELLKFMDTNVMKILDTEVKGITKNYQNEIEIDYKNLFYDAINGIIY